MQSEKNNKTNLLSKIFSISLYSVAALTITSIVFHSLLRVNETVRYSLSPIELDDASEKVFIAEQKASKELVVEEKVVAEKIDLERKVIRIKDGADANQVQQVMEEKGAEIVTKSDGLIVAKVPKIETESLEKELVEQNQIDSLEVDYPTFLTADSYDWGVQRIEAPEVWDTTAATGIKVAVIDTGIDYTHPDLQQRYAGGYDTVNEDSDPFDDHGHGTHVSGIIAADLNETGQAGVAPKASILAIKALSQDGTGYISDLVEAIDWAINNNVTLINFSLGTSYDSKILEDKLQEAADSGIILVAAAGNTNGGSVLYPAAYNQVISVAATDSNDNFASFSSVGAEIAAPGVSIKSTIPGGGYASWSGTSMAAPHVTATVALMVANKQENVRENLRNSAIDLGPSGTDSYFGYGLVHSKPAALGMDTLDPVVTFLSPEHESTVKDQVEIKIDVQDESKLKQIELWIDEEKVKIWEENLEEDYQYSWDTREVEQGKHTLIAKALDEYDNLGQARVEVEVNQEEELSPTPSLSPSPTPNLSITPPAGLSPTSAWYDRGKSSNNRKDIDQEPAMEHRQVEENAPDWANTNQEEGKMEENYQSGKSNEINKSNPDVSPILNENAVAVPPVTNSNQRQQKAEPVEETNVSNSNNAVAAPGLKKAEEAKPSNSGKNKGKVKGVMTQSWWQKIISIFF